MTIEHVNITSANCHEPKNIGSASTSDAGKVLTPSSTTAGESELRKLKSSELDISTDGSLFTYWGQYGDSTYTSGSPLSLPSGTRTKVTIDGLGTRTFTSELPAGVDLWDTTNNKVTPAVENDFYVIRLKYTVAGTASTDTVDAEFDIGGAVGTVIEETKPLLKGTGDTKIVHSWPIHAGTAFTSNGGEIYLTSSAATTAFDFEINIARLHKGS